MTQLFAAHVARMNCSYPKEAAISTREAVPIEAFGTRYINEGPVVYEVKTVPMTQWELKNTLEQYTKYLEAVDRSIKRERKYTKQLNTENTNYSFIQIELSKSEKELIKLLDTKTKYKETIKFCETYIIKG